MASNILVRKAILADTNVIAEIYIASRKKFLTFAPLTHSNEAIHAWIHDTLIPTTEVFVAEIDHVVVGMMALSQKEKNNWIEQLYISPEFVAGGVGEQFIIMAKSILHPPIRLRTFQENRGARRFYERHGFKILEFTDGSRNEEHCPDILYEWNPVYDKTALTPELYCSNIKNSLSFYIETLGFNIQYQRKEDKFVMLERQGARIMLEEIDGTKRTWITDTLEPPYGRGINLEIKTEKIDELYDSIQKAKAYVFLPIEEKQYRVNDIVLVNRQFIVLDPDGYMLRFSQNITELKVSNYEKIACQN